MRRIPIVIPTAAVVLAAALPAHADPEPAPRRWRVIGEGSLLARGNQGGLVEVGYRFGVVAGVLTPSLDVYLSLDRQMGGRRRVIDDTGTADGGWRDWVGSVRVGRRVQVVPGLWLVAAAGPSITHASITGATARGEEWTFGVDGTGAVVWGSGPVVASVIAGATAIPFDEELAVDGLIFTLPGRIEPWGGLGVGIWF